MGVVARGWAAMGLWGHRQREAEWEPFSLPSRCGWIACVTGPAGPRSRGRYGFTPVLPGDPADGKCPGVSPQ